MRAASATWRRAIGRTALILGAIGFGGGCSLLVEKDKTQCVEDKDCLRFDAGSLALCQQGVCIASGLGPPGCVNRAPTTEDDLLNRCTTGKCLPFDNCARLGLCNGAVLPAIKDPPQADAGQ